MIEEVYDVIIIGGGAAGLTAAIYTARKRLKTLVLSIDIGGQTNMTNHIENYPGVDAIPGPKLMQKFQEQALNFGAEIIMGNAKKIKKENDLFTVDLSSGETYTSKTVIVASGKVPRKLGIPGEDKFLGRGVSTCVTCDAPLFKSQTVVIIGGGNSAIEGLIELAGICQKVYLVHRREEFRADEITIEKARNLKNAEFILNHVPIQIIGDKSIKKVLIQDVNSGEKRELEVNGLFLEIGCVVDISFIEGLCEVNKKKEIVIDMNCNTSCSGLFACGDVTHVPYKQTIISSGEGAKAGLEAHRYITGGKGVSIDWDH